jgi:hypothetical protein
VIVINHDRFRSQHEFASTFRSELRHQVAQTRDQYQAVAAVNG